MLKGAEIVLRCVRAEGVDLVFGYPGGAIMPLYDALEGSGIRHVLTRHEQGAVFAAEGVARATGKVGVAIATSGPGATNLVTGIADAKMDSVPLVCITGQVRSAADRQRCLSGDRCFRRNAFTHQVEPAGAHNRRNSRGDRRGISLGAQRTSGTGGHRYPDRHIESQERIFRAGEVHSACPRHTLRGDAPWPIQRSAFRDIHRHL